MIKIINILLVFLPLMISCQNQKKESQILENKNISCHLEDDAIHKVLQVPEVQELFKSIEKETKSKHGVSTLIYEQDSIKYYLRIGFNRDDRFQTYYLFNVNKNTCEITVENQLSGREFPLKEWQIRNKKYLDGNNNAFEEEINNIEKIDVFPLDYKMISDCIWGDDKSLCKLNISDSQFFLAKPLEDKIQIHIDSYCILPKINDLIDVYIIISVSGDSELMYLITVKDKKHIESLLIADSNQDNPIRTTFSINKDYNITTYDENGDRKLKNKYEIDVNGIFLKK